MDYLLITEQQLQKKYNSLSDKIRNVLDSESNVITVGQICRRHHLDDGRILIVNQLMALILLGFISPNDFRQEIMDNLHLNYQHANDIAGEIHEKIFAPIRSEIDKVYAPAAAAGLEAMERGPAQKTAKEENIIDLKTFQKQEVVTAKEEIVEKPAEIKKELPPIPLPSEAISKTETEPEGPVIIHKEIETKPTLGKQRSLGGLFGFLKSQKEGEKIQEQKPITAEVEIPVAAIDKRQLVTDSVAIEAPKPPKVVHYGDLKTPISKPTTDNQQLTTDNRQPITTVKIPEVPLPLVPKPFDATQQDKPEIKSKIFESEIEKARKSGMILNGLEIPRPSASIPRESVISEGEAELMVPIEIEEVPRQGFFSRIFQSLTGLFITKKKIIKEIPVQPTTYNQQPTTTVKMPEAPEPPQPFNFAQSKPETKKEFAFPLEIKLPEPPKVITNNDNNYDYDNKLHQPIKQNIPAIIQQDSPQKTATESKRIDNEEVIDLRTFEKVKK